MDDKTLYSLILGINTPWRITSVKLDQSQNTVFVEVDYDPDIPLTCAECKKHCTTHDHAPKRQWRHLDTCQYKTVINMCPPRSNCPEHGVKTVRIPWAEKGSRFTVLFEAVIISWLRQASIKSVSESFHLTWDEVDGIMQRAVERGLSRRKLNPIKNLGLDEKAFQKHHRYSTILLNKDNDTVIDVLDDRRKETLLAHLKSEKTLYSMLESVSLDMWDPYIGALLEFDPDLKAKMNFDRYHIAAHFSKAVDTVRANEHRELMADGDDSLKYSRFDWLKNAGNIDNRTRAEFVRLTKKILRTARAWAMKETAAQLWGYTYREAAEKAWKRLTRWMLLSRLPAMIKLAKTIRDYLYGIINAVVSGVTNAASESKNAVIQKIKARACGYRNRERFRAAILFHLGGLDMAPTVYRY